MLELGWPQHLLTAGTVGSRIAWIAFLRSLKARGLGGVQLVISDAHEGPATSDLCGADRAVARQFCSENRRTTGWCSWSSLMPTTTDSA
jgi:hypothetical protein